jgi:hypothetical protein
MLNLIGLWIETNLGIIMADLEQLVALIERIERQQGTDEGHHGHPITERWNSLQAQSLPRIHGGSLGHTKGQP